MNKINTLTGKVHIIGEDTIKGLTKSRERGGLENLTRELTVEGEELVQLLQKVGEGWRGQSRRKVQ